MKFSVIFSGESKDGWSESDSIAKMTLTGKGGSLDILPLVRG